MKKKKKKWPLATFHVGYHIIAFITCISVRIQVPTRYGNSIVRVDGENRPLNHLRYYFHIVSYTNECCAFSNFDQNTSISKEWIPLIFDRWIYSFWPVFQLRWLRCFSIRYLIIYQISRYLNGRINMHAISIYTFVLKRWIDATSRP